MKMKNNSTRTETTYDRWWSLSPDQKSSKLNFQLWVQLQSRTLCYIFILYEIKLHIFSWRRSARSVFVTFTFHIHHLPLHKSPSSNSLQLQHWNFPEKITEKMDSKPDFSFNDPCSTPKLPLFSFSFPISKGQEPPGMLTPPLNIPASIPFQWEEVPGKPRKSYVTQPKPQPASARCLELPPRLLCETKMVNIPSPTTVLDGPDVGRSLSYTLSFRRGWSMRRENKEGVSFASKRWGSFKKNKETVGGRYSDISASTASTEVGGGGSGDGGRVKITRMRKRSVSFLSLKSHTSSSRMWVSKVSNFSSINIYFYFY